MQIDPTRQEMQAAVDAARDVLAAARTETQRNRILDRARRDVERIRKRFKREIDKRAGGRPVSDQRAGGDRTKTYGGHRGSAASNRRPTDVTVGARLFAPRCQNQRRINPQPTCDRQQVV